MLSQVHIRRAYFSFCLLGIRHSKVTIIFIKRYFPISTRLICRSRTSSRDQRHIIIVVMCYFVYYLYFVRLCGIFQICGIQMWQPLGCAAFPFKSPLTSSGSGSQSTCAVHLIAFIASQPFSSLQQLVGGEYISYFYRFLTLFIPIFHGYQITDNYSGFSRIYCLGTCSNHPIPEKRQHLVTCSI